MTAEPENSSDFSCESCGGPLRAGLCPRCLLQGVFGAGDETAPADAEPRQLGDYELLEVIARGGMGVVWRARQRQLRREVALKLLRESCLPGEEPARRFRIEAEAAALLRHPHIVTVHEVGETGGRYFLSMELLAGSLADRLAAGPLPPREAAGLLAKVARAVQHAHDRGVLHRDLKPSNILLDENGEPRVGDFGLARLSAEQDHPTLTGALLGTPAYMAPEQATGAHGEVTTQTDIYSLGAVFYETLTGRLPFEASSHYDLLRLVANENPSRPSHLVAAVDRDLEVICLKCLEKKPAARYASARALSEDLERWRRGEPIHARPAPLAERVWKWSLRHKSKAALILTAAGALVTVAALTFAFTTRLKREVQLTAAAEREALHRLAAQHGETAAQLVRRGDWLRALPHLAENAALLHDDPEHAQIARLRFETIVRTAPRLAQLWLPDAELRGVDFDGVFGRVAIFSGRLAELYDPATGAAVTPPLVHEEVITSGHTLERGNRLLTETEGERWHLWDAVRGLRLASGKGNIYPVKIAPSVHDRHLALTFLTWSGREVEVHSLSTGERTGAPLTFDTPVLWAIPSPWQRKPGVNATKPPAYLIATEDGRLHLRDPDSLEPQAPPVELGGNPTLRFLHWESGTYALECDQDRGLRFYLYDLPGRRIAAQTESAASTHRVHGWFGSPARWCILVREDNGFSLRDTMTFSPLMLAIHEAQGYRAAVAPEAVVTSSRDGAMRIWDDAGNAKTPFLWAAGRPEHLVLQTNGEQLLCGSSEPAVRLWQRAENEGAWLAGPPGSKTAGMCFLGKSLMLARPDGALERWDPATRQPLGPAASCGHRIQTMIPSARGRVALLIGPDTASLWDFASGQRIGAPLALAGAVRSAALSGDGEVAAVLDEKGPCRAGAPGTLAELEVGPEMRGLALSGDGRRLLVFGPRQAELWSLPADTAAQRIATLPPAGGGVFSQDGRCFAVWGGPPQHGATEARVHECARGELLFPAFPHSGDMTAASFSPSGGVLLTTSRYDARLWSLADGRLLRALRDHPLPLQSCGFSPDGRLLWTRTTKETYLWETATGTLLAPPMDVESRGTAVLSDDARWLAAPDDKKGFRAWDISPGSRSIDGMRALARWLSGHRLTAEGALYPLTQAEIRAAQAATGGSAR